MARQHAADSQEESGAQRGAKVLLQVAENMGWVGLCGWGWFGSWHVSMPLAPRKKAEFSAVPKICCRG